MQGFRRAMRVDRVGGPAPQTPRDMFIHKKGGLKRRVAGLGLSVSQHQIKGGPTLIMRIIRRLQHGPRTAR